jgi:hypothetical protein
MKRRVYALALLAALLLATTPARAAAPAVDRIAAKAVPFRKLQLRWLQSRQAKLSEKISQLSQQRARQLQKLKFSTGMIGIAGEALRVLADADAADYQALGRKVEAAVAKKNALDLRINELKIAD